MFQLTFYYKYASVVGKLARMSDRNNIKKLFILRPINSDHGNRYFSYFIPAKVIFEANTLYLEVQYYTNYYQTDAFFRATVFDIEVVCVRQVYSIQHVRCGEAIPGSNHISVDIALPFVPKRSVLKKMGASMLSSELAQEGIYTLTFLRNHVGNLQGLLDSIRQDVETYLPNMQVFIIAIYNVDWFVYEKIKS